MKYLFLICLFFASVQPILAANYAVSPLLIENTIEPRDMFEETVKITNTTDRKVRIFPTVNEITIGEGGEVKSFVPASMSDNTTSITSWIAVTRGRVEINPGETIKIPISFTINPNAVAGEYHAFIGFAEGSKRDEAEALVTSGRAPGVVVRLSLVEKRTEYLRLNRFTVDRFVTESNDAVVSYELENVGGLPITPNGEIIFYNNRGVEINALPVNPEERSINPQSKVTFEQTIPELGVIGRHKALLNVEYGTAMRANLYDTTYFNVVPVLYLALIFGFLLLTSLLLALWYHRSKTRINDLDEEVSVYVRSGIVGAEKDHDINLKK
ncbi:hypothetical protein K2P47_03155 [Patescibacteria group bacterium]|nr:hypothetical protein [Patescibacteria group bacterium]